MKTLYVVIGKGKSINYETFSKKDALEVKKEWISLGYTVIIKATRKLGYYL